MAKFPVSIKARLLLIQNDNVLLLKQTKPNGGNYTLIGGTVEEDEFAEAALIRESREEVGIILQKNDLELIHVLHKRSTFEHRIILYFMADTFSGAPRSLEPHKFKKTLWAPIRQLPEKTTATVQQVIQAFINNEPYSEFRKK